MDAGKQQILVYFLEEAKEHLDTLEKGFLELQATVTDSERVNEMFRAAHSVKGGAAMLGFNSIQQISHRLEDCLKILKENQQQIRVDSKIESLFLKGFDALKELLERLQGPFGLRDDDAMKVVNGVEPAFIQLQDYLEKQIGEEGGASPQEFAEKAISTLKQMLQLFKQKESAANRQELQNLCNELSQLSPEIEPWQKLVKIAQKAISYPQHSYLTLARFVIKELKQATDLIVAGQSDKVAASYGLQQLAAGAPPSGFKEIVVVVEPKAAAKALLKSFNREQLSQIVKLISRS
ncbi:Hpt domain-containing protein [Ancylothrix sp. C2]|uniref:Hpt domain-containing protein n=1 Tax=Ancylothrix sp. D3o TaxID=2953691 RepID=UPI0021BB9088|nr:Hpt domain-containing protein [Ancylothrix sp. D3o]MCT7949007.1 Hpt domain-containing protein [Ancylothrix sp. D3o]